MFVYWIHYESHSDVESEGYVGVTSRLKARFSHHKHSKDNAKVRGGISKGAIMTVIFQGSEQECYDLEWSLRPTKLIGWNLCEGGGRPPNCKGRVGTMTGKTQSEATRKLQSAAKKDKTPNNAKLTVSDVITIKYRLNNSETLKNIAADYNVSAATILQIRKGVNWSHV